MAYYQICYLVYWLAPSAMCMASPASRQSEAPTLDPDLRAAISYDAELNDGNPDHSSQSLAERHYLRYLEHCTEPTERARIYTQLGALFNTNYNRAKGERPDYAKARGYFLEALKAEPDRVGLATIRARYGLATPQQSAEERLQIRIATYKWLSQAKPGLPKDKWLLGGIDRGTRESDLRCVLDYVSQAQASAPANMIYEAARAVEPVKSLEHIIASLPGTEPAMEAQKRLEAIRSSHPKQVPVQGTHSPVAQSMESVVESRATDSQVSSPTSAREWLRYSLPVGCAAGIWAWWGWAIRRRMRRGSSAR